MENVQGNFDWLVKAMGVRPGFVLMQAKV